MSMFVVIDYSDKAKRFCASGLGNLRMYYYVVDGNEKHLVRVEFYSEARLKELYENGIPVIDMSRRSFIASCMQPPRDMVLLSRARWFR